MESNYVSLDGGDTCSNEHDRTDGKEGRTKLFIF